MTAARCILAIARKDLRVEWRTLDRTVSSLAFAVIVLVLFQLTLEVADLPPTDRAGLLPGIFWTVLSFVSVVALARSLAAERTHDTLVALAMSPAGGTSVFLGKLLAGLVQMAVVVVVVLPLASLFYRVPLGGRLLPLVGVVALHAFGIVVLGTLFAGVVARLGRGEALLATLLLPAIAPLLLSAVRCTGAVVAGDALSTWRHWLLLGAGFDMLYLFVAMATFEFVMQD